MSENDGTELMETKLYYDIMAMMLMNGKERSERDWQKLIAKAGFSLCEITVRLE